MPAPPPPASRAAAASAQDGPRFVPAGIAPTDEQLRIQCATARTMVIEAHAGAAKTTTLALRIAESWQRGVQPAHILALTYTATACAALREALRRLGMPVAVVRQLRIRTFDEFAAGVLERVEGLRVPAIESPEELKPRVWEAIDRVSRDPDERWPEDLDFPSPGDSAAVEEFLQAMLRIKGSLQLQAFPPEGDIDPGYAADLGTRYMVLRTLRAYERIRRGGHPDHPRFRGPYDATYDLARLDDPEGGDEAGFADADDCWPRDVRVLAVDEMHDLNRAMYRILRRLMSTNRCFFCGVGDVDQVIHAQAGADAAFMRDRFDADAEFPVVRYPLGTSFRFGPALARAASRFKRKRVVAGAVHKTAVEVLRYRDAGEAPGAGGDAADCPDCESQVVALAAGARPAGGRKRIGLAVLLRHPHQSVLLENALLDAGIAYRVHGFDSYLLRPEVLLVRGLLAIALRDFGALQGRRDTVARIVEAFVFFCDVRFPSPPDEDEVPQRALLDRAVRDIADNTENLFHFLENQVLRQADPAVARRLRAAVAVARQDRGAGLLDRFIDALDIGWIAARVLVRRDRRMQAVRNIDGLRRAGRAFSSAAALFARLNGAETLQDAADGAAAGAVVLAPIAAVKGLEFDRVALPYLRAGEFPAAEEAAGASGDAEDNLFYVAITRARAQLVLLAHADAPSPFVARLQAAAGPA